MREQLAQTVAPIALKVFTKLHPANLAVKLVSAESTLRLFNKYLALHVMPVLTRPAMLLQYVPTANRAQSLEWANPNVCPVLLDHTPHQEEFANRVRLAGSNNMMDAQPVWPVVLGKSQILPAVSPVLIAILVHIRCQRVLLYAHLAKPENINLPVAHQPVLTVYSEPNRILINLRVLLVELASIQPPEYVLSAVPGNIRLLLDQHLVFPVQAGNTKSRMENPFVMLALLDFLLLQILSLVYSVPKVPIQLPGYVPRVRLDLFHRPVEVLSALPARLESIKIWSVKVCVMTACRERNLNLVKPHVIRARLVQRQPREHVHSVIRENINHLRDLHNVLNVILESIAQLPEQRRAKAVLVDREHQRPALPIVPFVRQGLIL